LGAEKRVKYADPSTLGVPKREKLVDRCKKRPPRGQGDRSGKRGTAGSFPRRGGLVEKGGTDQIGVRN